jgi:hypothetical protein
MSTSDLQHRVLKLEAALRGLVERCDRSELADGSSLDTLAEHALLGDFDDLGDDPLGDFHGRNL